LLKVLSVAESLNASVVSSFFSSTDMMPRHFGEDTRQVETASLAAREGIIDATGAATWDRTAGRAVKRHAGVGSAFHAKVTQVAHRRLG
jgi:hypothetical protein